MFDICCYSHVCSFVDGYRSFVFVLFVIYICCISAFCVCCCCCRFFFLFHGHLFSARYLRRLVDGGVLRSDLASLVGITAFDMLLLLLRVYVCTFDCVLFVTFTLLRCCVCARY